MENYVIKTGDIIRVFEDMFFKTNVDENGRYTAIALDGTIAPGFPVDSVAFVRVDGKWYQVIATYCEMSDIERNNGEVTYDLEELYMCDERSIEREYQAMLK